MSFAKKFFITLLTSCAFINAYATTFYRHAPFHLSMNANDTLVVNYDFEQQSGVHCSSNQKNICMNFFYKGSEKNTVLPITLLNDHLPDKKTERLADTLGQFTIRVQPSLNIQHTFMVSCEYIG
jgi:hypothetical protein